MLLKMAMKKALLIAMSILVYGLTANAGRGGNNGGGGDPWAVEFLKGLSSVCQWIQSDALVAHKRDDCLKEVADLSDSLSIIGRQKRIYSVEEDPSLLDPYCVFKAACVDLETRKIRIVEQKWDRLSHDKKLATGAMEMILLLDLGQRYTLVQRYLDSVAFLDALRIARQESFRTQFRKRICRFDESLQNGIIGQAVKGRPETRYGLWPEAVVEIIDRLIIDSTTSNPRIGIKVMVLRNRKPDWTWSNYLKVDPDDKTRINPAERGEILWLPAKFEKMCFDTPPPMYGEQWRKIEGQ